MVINLSINQRNEFPTIFQAIKRTSFSDCSLNKILNVRIYTMTMLLKPSGFYSVPHYSFISLSAY